MNLISSFCLILSLTFLVSCSDKTAYTPNPVEKLKTDIGGLSSTAAIITTDKGTIVFRFYTKAAPRTSARIMKLIQNKFYDGQTFSRVISNFIIQTGNPEGSKLHNGGSGVKIPAEINNIQHIKGTIGMAHSMNDTNGDSQFYITLTTLPHLDKKYTVFAQVIEGIDVISKIQLGDKISTIKLEELD